MTTPIEETDHPLGYPVAEFDGVGEPDVRLDQAQRTYIRSLEGWQKEAIVTGHPSGNAWRLACDEGEYANGSDAAPSPLCFFTAGVASSYVEEIVALADRREIAIDDLRVVVDNYYTRSGSAVRGTRTAGALPPELDVEVTADADHGTIEELLADATRMAPITGLLAESHSNPFSLVYEGEQVPTGEVPSLNGDPLPDPDAVIEGHAPTAQRIAESPVEHLHRPTEPLSEDEQKYRGLEPDEYMEAVGTPDDGDTPDLIVHMRGTCTARDDGLTETEIEVFNPPGSMFRLRADESVHTGGEGRAPDSLSYVSSGIAFCFMTHVQSYAKPLGKEIADLNMVQDTHLSFGGATSGTEQRARALPVESHVHLDTPEGEEFAREAFRIAERSCFLQALCRTPDLQATIRNLSLNR